MRTVFAAAASLSSRFLAANVFGLGLSEKRSRMLFLVLAGSSTCSLKPSRSSFQKDPAVFFKPPDPVIQLPKDFAHPTLSSYLVND